MVKVLVGDFNMDSELVTETLSPIETAEECTVRIINPTGVRGDGSGRMG